MEIKYYGANCVAISSKNVRIVIDDNLESLGLKSVVKPEDILVYTFEQDEYRDAKLVISDPGEYEVSGVSVFGQSARSHMDEEGDHSSTIYKVQMGGFDIGVTGHIHPDISEEYIEDLGHIDILILPIGGNGYTLDAIGAQTVIKKFDPKVVVPTHYYDARISYPVDQQPLEEAIKTLALEYDGEKISKFKPKNLDAIASPKLVVLERQ